MTLQINGLRKRFGTVQALDGVGFTVEPGEVFGSLGWNGAGKTTAMQIALGLCARTKIRQAEGNALERMAPGHMGLHAGGAGPVSADAGPRAARVLRLAVRGPARPGDPRCPGVAARFRIGDYADRTAESLSKGNQQKVQFIATVLHDPDVLIMDEPSPDWTRSTPRCSARRSSRCGSGQDADLQHPPARHRRGPVRDGGDHRSRTRRHQRPDPRGPSLDGTSGGPRGNGNRRRGAWLSSLPQRDRHPTRRGLHRASRRSRRRPAGGPARRARDGTRGASVRGRRPLARGGVRRACRGARRRGTDAGGSRRRPMRNLPNIRAVARRELTVRCAPARSGRHSCPPHRGGRHRVRPVIVSIIEGASTDKIAVYNGTGARPIRLRPWTPFSTRPAATRMPRSSSCPCPTCRRGWRDERAGTYMGVLTISRGASGDLSIRFYSNEGPMSASPSSSPRRRAP